MHLHHRKGKEAGSEEMIFQNDMDQSPVTYYNKEPKKFFNRKSNIICICVSEHDIYTYMCDR